MKNVKLESHIQQKYIKEGEKTFLDKQNLRQFIASRPVLQETFKEVLFIK